MGSPLPEPEAATAPSHEHVGRHTAAGPHRGRAGVCRNEPSSHQERSGKQKMPLAKREEPAGTFRRREKPQGLRGADWGGRTRSAWALRTVTPPRRMRVLTHVSEPPPAAPSRTVVSGTRARRLTHGPDAGRRQGEGAWQG